MTATQINPSPRRRGSLSCQMVMPGKGDRGHKHPIHDCYDSVASFCVENQHYYSQVQKHVAACAVCDPEEVVRALHRNRFGSPRILLSSDLATKAVGWYRKWFLNHRYEDGGLAFRDPDVLRLLRDYRILDRGPGLLECLLDASDDELRRVLVLHWRLLGQEIGRDSRRAVREHREGRSLLTPPIIRVLRSASYLPPQGKKLLSMFDACVNRSVENDARLARTLDPEDWTELSAILDHIVAAQVLQS